MPNTHPLFDARELQNLLADIGEAGLERLLQVYQLDLERRMQRMETAFAQHDYGTLALECHALRAATSAIGLSRFANELQLLEASAKHMASHHDTTDAWTDTNADTNAATGAIPSPAQQHRHLQLVLDETRPYLQSLAERFKKPASSNAE